MKIAVVGAGAVGCYFGGLLARAGSHVVLIGRDQHVDAIRKAGLLMNTQAFREAVPVTASTDISAIDGAGLVLCSVKSTDTQQIAGLMAPWLNAEATVISLQNGVENCQILEAALARPVNPAVVYVATEMAGPGQVTHHGQGRIIVGHRALSIPQQQLFTAAGIPVAFSDNVAGMLWSKLSLNCAYNALSAITQLPYRQLWESPGIQDTMRAALAECLAIAAAEGISIPGDPWANIIRIAETMPEQRSSTAQDLARKKPSEIDHLNGYIVRKAVEHRIPAPVNQLLYSLVKIQERQY